jgi:multidrug resistance efflux pump
VRAAITLTVLTLALYFIFRLDREYEAYPWTRDGQVQADIVGIAARVSGPMVHVYVKDNQWVHKGDPLFEIDPSTYAAEVANNEAKLALAQASTIEDLREAERRRALVEQQYVSVEDYQQANARYKEDVASEKAIAATLDISRLNLSYTKIFSPVNGYITNMHLAVGTYVTEGEPLMALVDTDSYYIYAYFQETVVSRIQPGDDAAIEFMGYHDEPVFGKVESIGWAIYRPDGSATNLLPHISPTIDWVRLAQRFPVRVRLNKNLAGQPQVPHGVDLRSGQTVSVIILKKSDPNTFVPWWVW